MGNFCRNSFVIMTITFDSNNLEKLTENVTFTDSEINDLVKEILEALGKRLQELIEKRSPRDTGKYASEWSVGDVQENTITVSNPDNLKFTLLEFTGRRKSRIKGKPLLHFLINGIDIFVTFVDHPGFQPEPHVRPALEDLGREGKQIMIDVFQQKFPNFK